MSYVEPLSYQPRAYHRKNPRWYHTHIIDWMMANPAGKLEDCAKHVGKTLPTLSAIIRSDMFQAALAHRKSQYAARQDLVLTEKLTEVAIASLDTILSVIGTKKGAIPLETLNRVGSDALQRLGYGVEQKGGATVVNVNQTNQVAVPVSREQLDDARANLKQHQQRIASGSPPSCSPPEALEAGAALVAPQKEAALVNASEEDVVASILR